MTEGITSSFDKSGRPDRATSDLRKRIDHEVKNHGVAEAIRGMDERNAKLDAAKERAFKTKNDGEVSNITLGGLKDFCDTIFSGWGPGSLRPGEKWKKTY